MLSTLLLTALALSAPAAPAPPDVSGITICGDLVQGAGCMLFTFDGGVSYLEVEDPMGFTAGSRVWVDGVYALTDVSCDPRGIGVIYSGSRLDSHCPVETFCNCVSEAPCGNEGRVVDDYSSYGCANSYSQDGATLGLTYPGTNYSLSADQLGLRIAGAVPAATSIVFVGDLRFRRPFAEGILCVGTGTGQLFRLEPRSIDEGGSLRLDFFFSILSVEAPLSQGLVAPGTTLYVQTAYFDAAGPCGGGWNWTNGLSVVPTP